MDSKMVDVTLHIDEDTTHDKREAFRDSLLNLSGVMTADSLDEKPHFMVVGYDPDVINSIDLLTNATHNGLHAELIGL
ncbi:MAG: ATP-binding protein [Gammaproteobacteria bacterium]|nr:ATP-binding protein [Gammaproteobacteria bacterium]